MTRSRPDPTHIVCPHCAAVNRVPAARGPAAARCGACHQPLFDGHPAAVDAPTLEKHLQGNDIPVLVDIWAPWCGPCRAMAPAFERAAAMLEPEIRLLKLNADDAPDLTARLGVQGIPALILFDHGQVAGQIAGAMDAARIVAFARGHAPQS